MSSNPDATVLDELEKWDDASLMDAFRKAMAAYPNGYKTSEQTVDGVAENEDDMAEADARFASLLDNADPDTGYGAWQPVESKAPQAAVPSQLQATVPPPPRPPRQAPPRDDDSSLSDLLTSWYYAGYYTGRYRALQEIRARGPPAFGNPLPPPPQQYPTRPQR